MCEGRWDRYEYKDKMQLYKSKSEVWSAGTLGQDTWAWASKSPGSPASLRLSCLGDWLDTIR